MKPKLMLIAHLGLPTPLLATSTSARLAPDLQTTEGEIQAHVQAGGRVASFHLDVPATEQDGEVLLKFLKACAKKGRLPSEYPIRDLTVTTETGERLDDTGPKDFYTYNTTPFGPRYWARDAHSMPTSDFPAWRYTLTEYGRDVAQVENDGRGGMTRIHFTRREDNTRFLAFVEEHPSDPHPEAWNPTAGEVDDEGFVGMIGDWFDLNRRRRKGTLVLSRTERDQRGQPVAYELRAMLPLSVLLTHADTRKQFSHTWVKDHGWVALPVPFVT